MVNRLAAALLAASFAFPCVPSAALADNQLGYQLLSAYQAARLPRSGGALGMDVGRGQVINSGGMTRDGADDVGRAIRLFFVSRRFGDVLGTALYEHSGGFTLCVLSIVLAYALIVPILRSVPANLVASADARR